MVAFSASLWSFMLFMNAFIAVIAVAARYEGPLDRYPMHGTEYMQPRYFPNILADVLKGRHHLPIERFPHAQVIPLPKGHEPFTDGQVEEALRQRGDDRSFIVLGPPYHGYAGKGFSTAFPTQRLRNDATDAHTFAFVSLEDIGSGHNPRLYVNGFASVRYVPDVEDRLKSHQDPVPHLFYKGNILTARELIEKLPEGIMGI